MTDKGGPPVSEERKDFNGGKGLRVDCAKGQALAAESRSAFLLCH